MTGTIGAGATLNSGDRLTGGTGTDTLSLSGSGSFDLNSLAAFTGFENVNLTGTGENLTLKNGQNLTVSGGSGNTVWSTERRTQPRFLAAAAKAFRMSMAQRRTRR